MHIPSTLSPSTQMFLKQVDLASRRFVTSELMSSDKFEIFTKLFTKKTTQNYFLTLDDFKKWRIALTIVAYKSDGL